MTWAEDLVAATERELAAVACPESAGPQAAYLRHVAPFLGMTSAVRRTAQRAAWRAAGPPPDTAALLAAAQRLTGLPQREYQYVAVELLGRHRSLLPPEALDDRLRPLLFTRPWWDTVDLAGSHVITPMVTAAPELVAVMRSWSATDDQWLIRAAIQHQRGRGEATDVDLLLDLCAAHSDDRRFFVAKAIGWALRDLTKWHPEAVRGFLAAHPDLPAVARREADRGLARLP